MMTATQYRERAANALALAGSASTPGVRDLYLSTARDWTALSITADAHEKWELDDLLEASVALGKRH